MKIDAADLADHPALARLKTAANRFRGEHDVISSYVTELGQHEDFLVGIAHASSLDHLELFNYVEENFLAAIQSSVSNYLSNTFEKCMYGNLPYSFRYFYGYELTSTANLDGILIPVTTGITDSSVMQIY
jgi:hypothetical protein